MHELQITDNDLEKMGIALGQRNRIASFSITHQDVLYHCFADIKAGVLGFCAGDAIAFRADDDVWLALVQVVDKAHM